MYILSYLHVHPALSSCTSCPTFMYILPYLHVHPALSSYTFFPIFMYIMPYLHVRPALPSCTLCLIMHILTYLQVHLVVPSCTWCFIFMYILPYRNLRAVIWFHFAIYTFVLLPSPVTISVLSFFACWPFLLNFFQNIFQYFSWRDRLFCMAPF